jgi:hypothetical protein
MLSSSRCVAWERSAHSVGSLGARRCGNDEIFSCELTGSLRLGQQLVCDVLDVSVSHFPQSHSWSAAVAGERRQSASTAHDIRTGYAQLSADELSSFRCFVLANGRQAERKSTNKEYIMLHSRGAVSFHPLFTAEDIGLRKQASVEHVIKVFLYVGEATASRWIEMPKGILLLQTIPGRPESGAIYLYDRQQRVFYFISFEEGRDDSLTTSEFEQLVDEYKLLIWTSNPAVLRGIVDPTIDPTMAC